MHSHIYMLIILNVLPKIGYYNVILIYIFTKSKLFVVLFRYRMLYQHSFMFRVLQSLNKQMEKLFLRKPNNLSSCPPEKILNSRTMQLTTV